ncbi:MAG TPA: hypothetical protein ENO30_04870, partial [Thermodesulfobium narugense]|nr:hypothetical protein [Thermodesulfobium narugense]
AHAPEGASEFDLDIPEGSKIGDIIKLLDLPDDEVANIFVDRSLKDREYIVKDGQRIAFFPLIAGG